MNNYEKILITGASSGIGQQLALDYGKQGADIWLLARSEDKLHKLAKNIQTVGGQGHILVCDATNEQVLLGALQFAQAASGGFDLVIVNAGWGGKMSYPSDKNIPVLNQIMDLNLRAATQTLEFFARYMAEARHGHLVGVSSIAGFRGLPAGAAYSASKAGLMTYLESLRFSMQPFGVHVTDIRPGFIKTPMTVNNKVPMPFLMDVEPASHKIIRAIARGRKRFSFPWQMALMIHLVRSAPDFLYDWLAAKAFGKAAVAGRAGKTKENTANFR